MLQSRDPDRRSWVDRLRRPALFVLAAAAAPIIGKFAQDNVASITQSSNARGIAAIVIWVLVLAIVALLGYRLLAPDASAVPRQPRNPGVDGDVIWSAGARDRLAAVTGNTRVSDVVLPRVHDGDMWGVERQLTLAEVALLRRLGQARSPRRGSAPRGDCEAVLVAAGVEHPGQSIGGLMGRGFLAEFNGVCTQTGEGQRVGSRFHRHFSRDPFLVAAYRTVTVRIDRAVMLDGRPLES